MTQFLQSAKDYHRIEEAIRFLGERFKDQPSLEDAARHLGISMFHFQKLFHRWAGISPKTYVQYLTKQHAKGLLKKNSLLDTSYESGLSGPGRLHDLFITCEAMSPGEYKRKGEGLSIMTGVHPCPYGECFIAVTSRGICALQFIHRSQRAALGRQFASEWINAKIVTRQAETRAIVTRIFDPDLFGQVPLRILCRGTNFQLKVWEALLKIPAGTAVAYQNIADSIGAPRAVRAVGHAVGRNPVAYLIPCHRVIRAQGDWGGYRWGVTRKRIMLAREAAAVRAS